MEERNFFDILAFENDVLEDRFEKKDSGESIWRNKRILRDLMLMPNFSLMVLEAILNREELSNIFLNDFLNNVKFLLGKGNILPEVLDAFLIQNEFGEARFTLPGTTIESHTFDMIILDMDFLNGYIPLKQNYLELIEESLKSNENPQFQIIETFHLYCSKNKIGKERFWERNDFLITSSFGDQENFEKISSFLFTSAKNYIKTKIYDEELVNSCRSLLFDIFSSPNASFDTLKFLYEHLTKDGVFSLDFAPRKKSILGENQFSHKKFTLFELHETSKFSIREVFATYVQSASCDIAGLEYIKNKIFTSQEIYSLDDMLNSLPRNKNMFGCQYVLELYMHNHNPNIAIVKHLISMGATYDFGEDIGRTILARICSNQKVTLPFLTELFTLPFETDIKELINYKSKCKLFPETPLQLLRENKTATQEMISLLQNLGMEKEDTKRLKKRKIIEIENENEMKKKNTK